MTLLNQSVESESRILARIGVILTLSVVIIAIFLYLVVNPFGRSSRDIIAVAIETPYVGQGVAAGTPVIMHGVRIGQVVSVSSIPGGGVRLKADLESGPASGLTDAMRVDFRPSNYFGVTGMNVTPDQDGQPLRSGMQISIRPEGDFALQALLYRLGELSNGVLNQRLISVVQRVTEYVDALNPLLETALIVGASVANVQTVSTEQLLRNATGISVAFPSFTDAMITMGDHFVNTDFVNFDAEKFKKTYMYYPVLDDKQKQYFEAQVQLSQRAKGTDEYFNKHLIPFLGLARDDLFSRLGLLESTHVNDLFPVVESVRALTDAVPKIVSPESFSYTLTELRTRFERMYAGSGDQRALQVRIMLDRLPGVAAPLGVVMGGSS